MHCTISHVWVGSWKHGILILLMGKDEFSPVSFLLTHTESSNQLKLHTVLSKPDHTECCVKCKQAPMHASVRDTYSTPARAIMQTAEEKNCECDIIVRQRCAHRMYCRNTKYCRTLGIAVVVCVCGSLYGGYLGGMGDSDSVSIVCPLRLPHPLGSISQSLIHQRCISTNMLTLHIIMWTSMIDGT